MHADFSVELGRDDPALEIPWKSDDSTLRYHDLRNHPEAIAQVPEAVAHPELSAFLKRINAPDSCFETAKCDVWQSREISPEEEIFGAVQKFVSYIDLLFVNDADRNTFAQHEAFAKEICALLSHAPDLSTTVELVIRRFYCHLARDHKGEEPVPCSNVPSGTQNTGAQGTVSGFYFTAYITGFGNNDCESRGAWAIAVALFQHALLQWSHG